MSANPYDEQPHDPDWTPEAAHAAAASIRLQSRTVSVEFRVLAESDEAAAEIVEATLDRSRDVEHMLAGYNSRTGEAQRGRWEVIFDADEIARVNSLEDDE